MLKIHCHTETARMSECILNIRMWIGWHNLQLVFKSIPQLFVSILVWHSRSKSLFRRPDFFYISAFIISESVFFQTHVDVRLSWQDNNRPQNSPSERGSLNTARTGRKVCEKYKHIRKRCISTFLLPSLSPLFSQRLLISGIKSSYRLLLYFAARALYCIIGRYFANES